MDMGYPYGAIIHKYRKSGYFDTIIIYSDLAKYGENNDYIIALQKPNKKLMLDRIKSSLEILYKYNPENDSIVIFFPHTYTNTKINRQYKKDLASLVQITQDSVKAYQIEAEGIFRNDSFYQKIYKNPLNYYIIDKKENFVLGPLTNDEFKKAKHEKEIRLEFRKIK